MVTNLRFLWIQHRVRNLPLPQPKDSGYYEFSANDELVITKGHNNLELKEAQKKLNFNLSLLDRVSDVMSTKITK